MNPAGPFVLKFGGELLEDEDRLATIVSAVARVTSEDGPRLPVLIVHGGGKEIDGALRAAGIEKRQVDGLRVTDAATLGVVVAVLGTINTRVVAALTAAGVRAVGLTGADARCGLSVPAPPHRAVDGRLVDLGRVGIPSPDSDPTLLTTLMAGGFVPVIACIGMASDGRLLNVNADTLAGHLAARLGARRLAIAGTTPGVLGPDGSTTPTLDAAAIERLVTDRTATAGMVAKLRACADAIAAGVGDVLIVDGRDAAAIVEAAAGLVPARATRVAGSKTVGTSRSTSVEDLARDSRPA